MSIRYIYNIPLAWLGDSWLSPVWCIPRLSLRR
jgi:hypothetical protein